MTSRTGRLAYGAPLTIMVPTVLTDRLVLRCLRASDIDPYAEMNADPETMKYMARTFDRISTEKTITQLIGMWMLRGHGMWAIEDRRTGEFVGRGGTYYTPEWPGVEVAVSIRRDRWRQGLGTEVVRATLDFGFSTLDVDEMVTVTHPSNAGMNRIARKLGMTLRDASAAGPRLDSNVYVITRAAWKSQPPT